MWFLFPCRHTLVAALLLLMACGIGYGEELKTFEGVVSYKTNSSEGESRSFSMHVSGSKTRFEFTGENGSGMVMIMDYETRSHYIIKPADKVALKFPLNDKDIELHRFSMGEKAQIPQDAKLKELAVPVKTGKTKQILGYTCEQWTFVDEQNNKAELWNARGLGTFFPSFMLSGVPQRKMLDNKMFRLQQRFGTPEFFPFLIVSTTADAKEGMNIEVTAVEAKQLDASLFYPPVNFTLQDFSNMPPSDAHN